MLKYRLELLAAYDKVAYSLETFTVFDKRRLKLFTVDDKVSFWNTHTNHNTTTQQHVEHTTTTKPVESVFTQKWKVVSRKLITIKTDFFLRSHQLCH